MKYSLKNMVSLILLLLGCGILAWDAYIYSLPNQMVFGLAMLMLAVSVLLPYLDSKRKIKTKIECATVIVWVVMLIISALNIVA